MYPWLFRLVCGALVVGVLALGGVAHAAPAQPYGVDEKFCGSFANAMAKMARGHELGVTYLNMLKGRLEGAEVCRQEFPSGCPSADFIAQKAKEAWERSEKGGAAYDIGEHFFQECEAAYGHNDVSPDATPSGAQHDS